MKDKEFVVEKIRSQYTQAQYTELDALKALDARVKKPARIFAFTFGSIGAMVMGAGMRLCMTDLGAVLGNLMELTTSSSDTWISCCLSAPPYAA